MPRSIKITGIAPPDLSGLPESYRRQFWAIVAPIALKVKDDELAAGLDKSGEPLKPISEETRRNRRSAMTPTGKGDPNAPPLMPAYQKSRTRSLLAARAFATHVELYWRFDPFTGDQWSRILEFQRKLGRDVFGVSPAGIKRIRQQSWAAWTRWKKTAATPTEARRAFPAAALSRGPQSRIARVIAGSALPNAGGSPIAAAGNTSRKFITRGILAPTKAELKTGQFRGGLTGPGLRRHLTEEIPGGRGRNSGGVAVSRPRPPVPRPAVAALKQAPKPPAPAPIKPVSTGLFADRTVAIARAVPDGLRYGVKVWIIDAYDAYVLAHPGITLPEFKRLLIEANRARLINLSRFDLIQSATPTEKVKDAMSETFQGVATFHFIVP